jgi:hypothetical protein
MACFLSVALSEDLWSCEPILLSIPRKLPHAESNLKSIANHLGTAASPEEKRTHECSKAVGNSSIFCVATIALAFSSNAYAQTSYKVADQGTLGDDNFGMVMGRWAEITRRPPLSITADKS